LRGAQVVAVLHAQAAPARPAIAGPTFKPALISYTRSESSIDTGVPLNVAVASRWSSHALTSTQGCSTRSMLLDRRTPPRALQPPGYDAPTTVPLDSTCEGASKS
jgi:hypothetical protein